MGGVTPPGTGGTTSGAGGIMAGSAADRLAARVALTFSNAAIWASDLGRRNTVAA